MARDLKTGWKRIGRSGPAVDGREIKPEMIDQAAKNYKKDLFTALIWPEHFRYFNMGTVEALRAEANEEGGRDLFAMISPNQYYLQANAAGQKLFTSMELTPNFRKTGEWYLTGLGATDDPASAATTEMRLSAKAKDGAFYSHVTEITEHSFNDQNQPGFLERLFKSFSPNHPEDEDMADQAEIAVLKTQLKELSDKFAALKIPRTDDKDAGDKPVDEAMFNALLEKLDQRYAHKPTDPAGDKTPADDSGKLEALFTKLFDKLDEKFSQQNDKAKDPKAELESLQDQVTKLSQSLANALKEQSGTDAGQHFGSNEKLDDYL